jgi:vancomycin permeability regulator SanA
MILFLKKFLKTNLKNILSFFVILIFIILIFSSYFVINYQGKFPKENQTVVNQLMKISQVENKICGVIFGARVYPNNNPSSALFDRLQTGVQLYNDKIINCLILSGGASEKQAQHEVIIMQKIAKQNGIPTKDLLLDFAGKNSLQTLSNLPQRIDYFVLISNDFHLARLKMLSWKIDLKNSYTYSAKYHFNRYAKEKYFIFREIIAIIYYFFLPL